jgi:predicted ATP-grasp superfamily ATP-dependent carboligase
MNILLTDADFKHSLGLIRNLGENGHRTYVISLKKYSLCNHSKYCAGEIIVSNYSSENFEKEFLDILEKYSIDLVIPVGTLSYKRLVPLKDKYPKKINLISVDKDKLAFCFSKKNIYKLAETLDIPIPKTYYPRSLNELNKIKKLVTYPCVIKSSLELGENVVDYVYNEKEFGYKYELLKDRLCSRDEDAFPIVQEYIPGNGCGFFAVYNNGQCGVTFQHFRIREYPPSGGVSACSESLRNKDVQAYGKKLLDSLEWHGVAMVEFKMNGKESPVLLEINPKFWGSCDLGLEAGVNFPLELIKIAKNQETKYSDDYKYPFKYHWPLQGDFDHAISNHRNLWSFIKDCLNPKVKSNLWWKKDPKPTLCMFKNYIAEMLEWAFMSFQHKLQRKQF